MSSVFTSVMVHITQSLANSRCSVNICPFMMVADVLLLVGLLFILKRRLKVDWPCARACATVAHRHC